MVALARNDYAASFGRLMIPDYIIKRESEFFDKFYQTAKITRIQDPLSIPEVNSLAGARVLICACGIGREAVRAANAGAEVFAFDISPVAVEMTLKMAEVNGVRVAAQVMDFNSLMFPNDFFDFVYGSSVIHHVDCSLAVKEVYRCLKPGGIAFFSENSDRNPILRWVRRSLFGVPGGYQRQRFLFFRREGTTDEYPVTEKDIQLLSDIFGGNIKRIYQNFMFFELLSKLGWRNGVFLKCMQTLDRFTVRIFPMVMKYSFWQGIWLQKQRVDQVCGVTH